MAILAAQLSDRMNNLAIALLDASVDGCPAWPKAHGPVMATNWPPFAGKTGRPKLLGRPVFYQAALLDKAQFLDCVVFFLQRCDVVIDTGARCVTDF